MYELILVVLELIIYFLSVFVDYGPYKKEMNCLNCNYMILEHHIVYGNDNESCWKCEYCKSNKYD